MWTARRAAARVASVTLQGALVGIAYSAIEYGHIPVGAAVGATLGAVFSFLEAVVVAEWVRGWPGRLPFALYFALRVAVYFTVVIAVNFAAVAITGDSMGGSTVRSDVEFALVVCVALNLLFSVNELLGPGVLFAFAAGRYRRPRREERVLLYLDLCGSTAIAERLGEARFLDLLNAFFADVSEDIVREGGEIHKYVGDEVIATWNAATEPERPIRACFAARNRLAAQGGTYRAAFGEIPAFRAAIHAGAVVIGELGAQKKEIALIGDAMNTAARILEAARETGAAVLISAPYYGGAASPLPGIAARPLPPIPLRGKSAPLALIALAESGLSAAPGPI
jgi:adenylate cyclase